MKLFKAGSDTAAGYHSDIVWQNDMTVNNMAVEEDPAKL